MGSNAVALLSIWDRGVVVWKEGRRGSVDWWHDSIANAHNFFLNYEEQLDSIRHKWTAHVTKQERMNSANNKKTTIAVFSLEQLVKLCVRLKVCYTDEQFLTASSKSALSCSSPVWEVLISYQDALFLNYEYESLHIVWVTLLLWV